MMRFWMFDTSTSLSTGFGFWIRRTQRMGIVFFVPIALLVAFCSSANAQQQGKIARVGFLTGSSLSAQWRRNEAFRRGLRDLGYIDGKNIVIDWRSYEGNRDRQRALLGELVRLNVDVIVAVGSGDIRAAKEAT